MRSKMFLLLVFILLLNGCSKNYVVVPEYQQVNPKNRITKQFSEKVQLVNNQESNEEKYFSDFSTNTLSGNMHMWTDQVIELTKNELEKRGGIVYRAAEKKLFLAFYANEVEFVNFVHICKGTLSVKTSSGYEGNYFVQNRSPGNLNRTCGGAITLSVIELLNDQNIHDYLSTTE